MSHAIRRAADCPTRRIGLYAVLFVLAAAPARACDLDGLSHGYGPMAALFAGAHHYQSLNGFEDEEPPPEPTATVDAPADAAGRVPEQSLSSTAKIAPSSAALPPTPRRSFVAWAKARPKGPEAADAPASWTRSRETADASERPNMPAATPASGGAGRPPGGGPVP